MRPITATEALELWEEGSRQSLLERTIRLLSKACSIKDLNSLCKLSIGERDIWLLQLREEMFGSVLRNKGYCPNCLEAIEWETDTGILHLQSLPVSLSAREFLLEKNGFSIKFRLPNSLDISRINQDSLHEDVYKKILSDCILSVSKDGNEISSNDLPGSILETLNNQMSVEDPQADISMDMVCPSCQHRWEMYFDISSYLWAEINNWAKHVLSEVYLLAKAFNWSENDILNMTAQRRQLYIEMIQK